MVKFKCEHEVAFWQDTFLSYLNSQVDSDIEHVTEFADAAVLALRERYSLLEGELGHEEKAQRPS